MEKIASQPYAKLALFYAVLLGLFTFWLLQQGADIAGTSSKIWQWQWVPSLNIALIFRLDGLSLIFGVMIGFIGMLIFTYSAFYMRAFAHAKSFHFTLFAFAVSMLGLVLSDNIILMFVFWELTSITSYLLIATHKHIELSRRNALQALLVTSSGSFALLAGLIWMGLAAGSTSLSEIIASPEFLLTSPYVTPIFILVIMGCFAKSAQWPYSFWLPNAMVAPTPVSAYLHSATMVKAGIYLLARLQPALSFNEYWTPILATLGLATMVYGAILSVKQTDLKLMLAYTTVMALGTLTFLLAFPSRYAAVAAMVFMVAHALYKAALFMLVGVIEKYTGTRKRHELSGLGKQFPELRLIALASALSMAGIPFLFGFIAKETIYDAIQNISAYQLLISGLFLIANALIVALAYVLAVKLFEGEARVYAKPFSAPPLLLWMPAAVAAYLGIALAFFPEVVDHYLIAKASTAITGFETDSPLRLWHGFNMALLMSGVTIALGGMIAWKFGWFETVVEKVEESLPITIEKIYYKKLDWLDSIAKNVTAALQTGSLHFYIRIIFSITAASILTMIFSVHSLQDLLPVFVAPPYWMGAAFSIAAIFGAWIAMRAASKIIALVALGISGFAIAGIFLIHGALDVAITQFLIETLMVVLAAAVLWKIPDFNASSDRDKPNHAIDIGIALMVGLAVYFAICSVLTQTLDLSVTAFYENASLILAHGRNIVNVILVDFRAFDTLGETTVVGIAALGVWAIMQKSPEGVKNP